MNILVLYNHPALPPDHPDAASEAGILDSVDAVIDCLRNRGHMIDTFAVSDMAALLDPLSRYPRPDVVFNLFEGFDGVGRGEAEVTGLFQALDWPVTGSPSQALALARDKARTKWLLGGAGVPTAQFVRIEPGAALDQRELSKLLSRGSAIVKPANEDASLGISNDSIVRDLAALEKQVAEVARRYGPVLVEQFIVGREFNVGIVALPTPTVLPLAEIEFTGPESPGWQIVTYEAKWAAGSAADLATTPRCPANVEPAVAERIRETALRAFELIGCRHYARVDLRVDAEGTPFVLEVNTNPDIGPTAGFARALAASGMEYEEFIEQLVQSAGARN